MERIGNLCKTLQNQNIFAVKEEIVVDETPGASIA